MLCVQVIFYYRQKNDAKLSFATAESYLLILADYTRPAPHGSQGNIFFKQKKYAEALSLYQKGIHVEPMFASNYLRAAYLYSMSNEKVWAMLYGEIFMNLERDGSRNTAMSSGLYSMYTASIEFGEDTTLLSFYDPVDAVKVVIDEKTFEFLSFPFGAEYESLLSSALVGETQVNMESLNRIRTKFVESYIEFKRKGIARNYDNFTVAPFLDYLSEIYQAGHLEAYNYWILKEGDRPEFEKWHTQHEQMFNAFLAWFDHNGLKIEKSN